VLLMSRIVIYIVFVARRVVVNLAGHASGYILCIGARIELPGTVNHEPACQQRTSARQSRTLHCAWRSILVHS
jgi:hypothetical protein